MKWQYLVLAALLSTMAQTALAGSSHKVFNRSVPIVNFDHQEIKRADNKTFSMDDVLKAIRTAAGKREWKIEPGDTPGHVIATLLVRNTYTAVVEITYTTQEYSMDYKSSANLDYDKHPSDKAVIGKGGQLIVNDVEVIHPNYNKWVREFNTAILNELLD